MSDEVTLTKEEYEALKAKAEKSTEISFKVSPKGAVSVYGLGRFPVTLYVGQWERLRESWDGLWDFIEAMDKQGALSRK